MINDSIIKKAQKKAYQSAEKIAEEKEIPQPQSLESIRQKRIIERELEKHAPSTGYPELDKIVKGFIPGHLYTLTGVENVGKTSIACNFAVRVAIHGRRVLYIALEPDNTVIEYLASVMWDKRFDELDSEDLDLSPMSIDVYSKEAVETAEDLVEIIDTLDRYDLVIVDHIGYFITSEKNFVQQQSNVLKKLVGTAKRKKCAIMVIAHLKKRNKAERKNYIPNSNDISGSGSFQQDSTEVFIVTRSPKTEEKDEVAYADFGKFYVTKTKAGPNGWFGLKFSERKANILSNELAYQKSMDETML